MSAPTTIPVMVEPEAAERVAELGLQAEFARMLEHARQTIPGLRRIDVALVPAYDTGDDPGIFMDAVRDASFFAENDPIRHRWREWVLSAFPPDVHRHFTLWDAYESNHAG